MNRMNIYVRRYTRCTIVIGARLLEHDATGSATLAISSLRRKTANMLLHIVLPSDIDSWADVHSVC
jgi:hypothetical protein